MNRTLRWFVSGMVLALALLPAAPAAQAPDMFERIRAEGVDHSQIEPMFATLTDDIGPRLTGSPAFKQAIDWARNRMQSSGLTNAHLESWPFGRGWVLDGLTIEMTKPRFAPLIGYADAWSPSTNGDITSTPAVAIRMATAIGSET